MRRFEAHCPSHAARDACAGGATRAGAEELPAGGGGAGGDAGGGRRDSEEMLGRQAALWELLGGRRGDSAWPSYP